MVAFEFRHASWFDDEVFACLKEHNRALCMAEMDDKESSDLIATASWGYLRLRRPDYDDAALAGWADRVRGQGWRDAFVFFKHEDEGKGPRMAGR